MKNTVLMSIVAVAGLASSAMAQYTFESRLVLDNDPQLALLGINYGTRALLPGPLATAVGITLIARVTSTGTTANYGVAAMGGGGSSTAPNSRFSHNDALSNNDTALNFNRGSISSTGVNVGLLSYNQTGLAPGGLGAQQVNFRALLGSSANTAATNAGTQVQPVDAPYTPGNNNANGFLGATGGDSVLAVTAQRGTLPDDGSGDNPFVNFAAAGNDADVLTAGVQSAWVGIYHIIFLPTAATNLDTRQVTVSFAGFFRAGTVSSLGPGGYVLQTSSLTGSQAAITFLVPTPGAAALLGLGGLVAGRRRRA